MTQITHLVWETIKQVAQHEPSFSEASVRWHVFNAKRNGLDPHVRRIGRKVLVNVAGFRQWIANQG